MNYAEGQVQNSKTCHVTIDSDGKLGGEGKMHVGSLFEVNFLPCKYLLPGATYKILSFKDSLLTWTLQPLSHSEQQPLGRALVPLRDNPRCKT